VEVERHAVVSSVVVLLCDTAKGMYMKKKKKLFLEELKTPSKKTQAACLRIVKENHAREMAKKPTPVKTPMNWCYALVKTGDKDNPYYALVKTGDKDNHYYMVKEIYHVQGQIVSYCDSPVILGAEDPKDVVKLLRRIIKYIKGSPFVS
jgi:transcription antitermination factor NusG